MPSAITPDVLVAAEVGIQKIFDTAFKETPTYWEQIAQRIPSSGKEEIYPWATLIPELREWLGERQVITLESRFQRLLNRKFERTIGIKREDLEDDKLGLYTGKFQEMAQMAKKNPDKLVIDALQAGKTATVYDNQYFFDTDHPVDPSDAASAVQANLFTGCALTEDNVFAKRATMMAYKVDNNVPLEIVPNALIVPPQLEQKAKKICESDQVIQAVAGVGVAGVSNVAKGLLKPIVIPRLSNEPDAWYLADTTRPVKPMLYQSRVAAELTIRMNPEDPRVFDLDEYVAGVRAREAAGYGPWFLIARCEQ